MSMFLFALGVDPVITRVEAELGEISAYADDIVIGLKPDITPEYAIQRAKELYAEIGLEIQPKKCQISGGTEPVVFLGHPFQEGQSLTIAEYLVETAKRKLKILTQFEQLRATAAFIMLYRSVVPALNYGPLVECGEDDAAYPYYKMIDALIMPTLRKILSLPEERVSDEELYAFAVAMRQHGGLEFMLPGEYFKTMKEHGKNLVEANPVERLKQEYFRSEEYKNHHFKEPDCPPVAAALPYADLLKDEELTELLAMRFGIKDCPEEKCPSCGKSQGRHDPTCTGYMSMLWSTHNDILRLLLSQMLGKRMAAVRQVSMEGQDGRHLSDGYFRGKDGVVYQVDVSVVWTGSMDARYNEKMRHSNRPEAFIPFVVSAAGKIHPESRRRIQEVAPEMTNDVLARVTLIPLARRQAERLKKVAKSTLKGASQMLPEHSGIETGQVTVTTKPNPVAAQAAPSQAGSQPTSQTLVLHSNSVTLVIGSQPQQDSTQPNLESAGLQGRQQGQEQGVAGAREAPPSPQAQNQEIIDISDSSDSTPSEVHPQANRRPVRDGEVWGQPAAGRALDEGEQAVLNNINRAAEENRARLVRAFEDGRQRGNGIRVMDAALANQQELARVQGPIRDPRDGAPGGARAV